MTRLLSGPARTAGGVLLRRIARMFFLAAALPLAAQAPPPSAPSPAPAGPASGSARPPSSAAAPAPVRFEEAPAFGPSPDAPSTAGRAATPAPPAWPSVITVVFWTGMVLVMLCGFLALLKRWGPARGLAPGEAIRLLARRSLDSRHQLWLVETGRKVFLIGTTKDGFSRLGELSSGEDVAAVRGRTGAADPDSASRAFDEALRQTLKAHEGKAPEEGALDEKAEGVLGELADMRRTVERWKVM